MRHLFVTLLLILGFVSAGCGTISRVSSGGGEEEATNVFRLRGLTLRAPEGKEWTHLPGEEGQYFILLQDGMADFVTLFTETTPLDRKLTSVEQLFARLNTDPAVKFDVLEMDTLYVVEVLRFTEHSVDSGEDYERIRRQLKVAPRPDYPNYHVSKRGIIVLHPSEQKRFVTVACIRNSYHGFIGSHFESVSDAYFAQFVGENLATPATETIAGTLEDPLPLQEGRAYTP